MEPLAWLDKKRMPTLDEQGSRLLRFLLDQPAAPVFRNRSGHHLTAAELIELKHREQQELLREPSPHRDDHQPWLPAFIDNCFRSVPFYRQYQCQGLPLEGIPSITRDDLSFDVSAFVPDHLTLDRMIAYTTSGTTGHPLIIPSHPQVAARYSIFHKQALSWNGIDTEEFNSDLAVVLAGYQEKCFTYVSLSPYLNNKALAKMNFHPVDWSHPDDRITYLDNNKPDLISGDPISLVELSRLSFQHQPRALLSTSMTLLDSTRHLLQQRFGCPVVDLYSLNESGPVAASVPGKQGFRLLQSHMLVEVVDSEGNAVPEGQRGEITLTGGFNDYLPLLRYRTGDYGVLKKHDQQWFICDLEGRPPVCFQTRSGQWLNNVDVTHLLAQFALSQFSLHQYDDGRLELIYSGIAQSATLQQVLEERFQFPVTVHLKTTVDSGEKIIQYTSDLPGGENK